MKVFQRMILKTFMVKFLFFSVCLKHKIIDWEFEKLQITTKVAQYMPFCSKDGFCSFH